MLSLRVKFVILLIAYFAGFATAVYLLTPASQRNVQTVQAGLDSSIASSQAVQSLNTGLHKAVEVTKAAAKDAGGYIRQKLNETNKD
jgi:hypothetical protein